MQTNLENLNNISNVILDQLPEIIYIGDPILRNSSVEVTLNEGLRVGKLLITTLGNYRGITGIGRGLAAPQIGINSAVFVTFIDVIFKIYINPKIIFESEKKNIYKENCLSSSHVWCDVIRSESIQIEYMNEIGETINENYSGFGARLIQHEIDHLQGVVSVDKAEKGTLDYKFGDPLKEVLREI
jgi:peptide deformylase